MAQRVVIASSETTFSATCETCGTTFAGRLDDDLAEGVFLCREGHSILIVRAAAEPPDEAGATAAA